MNEDVCFLVTIVHQETLLQCALQIDPRQVPGMALAYPMEHRDIIASLLPLHVRNAGPVVAVEKIFAIHCHAPHLLNNQF